MERNLSDVVDAAAEKENKIGAPLLDSAGEGFLKMVARADSLHKRDSGRSINDFAIGDPAKMGDAIGMFELNVDKKSLRPDAFRDFETLAHTTMHETRHQIGFLEIGGTVGTLNAGGNGSVGCEGHCVVDGLIEHYLHEEYGFKPVDAYADLARAAGKIVNELGAQTYTLASQGAESEGLLVEKLVSQRMGIDGQFAGSLLEIPQEQDSHGEVMQVIQSARRDVQAMFAQRN